MLMWACDLIVAVDGTRFADVVEDDGIPNWQTAPPVVPARKDDVRAEA